MICDSGSDALSVNDMGVLYGYGLFETLRIYNGFPFLVEEHINRMIDSAQKLFFTDFPTADTLLDYVYSYLEQNHFTSLAIRLSVSYGNKQDGIMPSTFISKKLVSYSEADYEKGISALISPYKKNQYSPLVYHKTFNYLENMIAIKLCRDQNVRECIFLNTSDHLAEGAISNIFFIRDGKVCTPSEDCGILPGITRRHIINLIKNNVPLLEGHYRDEDLFSSDECFCTNSLMEVMPLVKINEKRIGNGVPGALTKKIQCLYRRSVERYSHENSAPAV